MKKKTTPKSKASKSVKDLSRRSLNAKTARVVKGGVASVGKKAFAADESPKETAGFEYGGRSVRST